MGFVWSSCLPCLLFRGILGFVDSLLAFSIEEADNQVNFINLCSLTMYTFLTWKFGSLNYVETLFKIDKTDKRLRMWNTCTFFSYNVYLCTLCNHVNWPFLFLDDFMYMYLLLVIFWQQSIHVECIMLLHFEDK